MGFVAAVFDWDCDGASSHDGGEAQLWYDGGDTVDKSVTGTTKLREFVGRGARVMCRVAFEESGGLDRDRASESRC